MDASGAKNLGMDAISHKICLSQLLLDQGSPFSSGMPNAANKYACTINSLLSLRGRNCRAICSKLIANSALEREFRSSLPGGPSGRFGGFEEQASMADQQHKVGTSVTGKSTKGRSKKDNVCRHTPFGLFRVHPAERYWKEAKNHSQCLLYTGGPQPKRVRFPHLI